MAKRQRKRQQEPQVESFEQKEPRSYRKSITITPLNRTQKDYSRLIDTKDIVFAVGRAGTGKTYLAALHAVKAYSSSRVERIVVCRPAIEAGGEQIGFLPGGINEKMDPYVRPIIEVIREYCGNRRLQTMLEYGHLEVVPLGFMRGRTFKNSFIIADEMQNSTVEQLLMLLTRLGEGSQMVITGDPTQRDIKTAPCFEFARRRLGHLAQIGFVDFSREDVVRHATVEAILQAWDQVEPTFSGMVEQLNQSV